MLKEPVEVSGEQKQWGSPAGSSLQGEAILQFPGLKPETIYQGRESGSGRDLSDWWCIHSTSTIDER